MQTLKWHKPPSLSSDLPNHRQHFLLYKTHKTMQRDLPHVFYVFFQSQCFVKLAKLFCRKMKQMKFTHLNYILVSNFSLSPSLSSLSLSLSLIFIFDIDVYVLTTLLCIYDNLCGDKYINICAPAAQFHVK